MARRQHGARIDAFFRCRLQGESAAPRVPRLRLDHAQRSARLALWHASVENHELPESEAPPRRSSRRLADARIGPVAHLGWHETSPGASRRLGLRSNFRPNPAAAATERRTTRTDAKQQTEGNDSHATRSPYNACDLCFVSPK